MVKKQTTKAMKTKNYILFAMLIIFGLDHFLVNDTNYGFYTVVFLYMILSKIYQIKQ